MKIHAKMAGTANAASYGCSNWNGTDGTPTLNSANNHAISICTTGTTHIEERGALALPSMLFRSTPFSRWNVEQNTRSGNERC